MGTTAGMFNRFHCIIQDNLNTATKNSMTNTVLTDVRMADLDLDRRLLQALNEAGFSHCTPIQSLTLPAMLKGEDIAGQAKTGTGKTAAFLLGTMQRLLNRPADPGRKANDVRAVILAPTRELAIQIHNDAEQLGPHTGLRLGLAYGGVDYDKQRDRLTEGVDILIGTPGRVIDYFKQGVFRMKSVEVTVLDEADRMFDLGFISDVRYLLRRMPAADKRLNLLFSATLSFRVTELAYEHMNNPREVAVASESITADHVTQAVYYPANNEKIPLLIGLLRSIKPTCSIIFVNTKRAAEVVSGYLVANHLDTAVLSGDVPQRKRESLIRRFKDGDLHFLVATDVAARGLHIPNVTHVFNFDLPHEAQDYVHRIGRTARMDATGDAISFAGENYAVHLPEIEAFIGYKIPYLPISESLLAQDLIRPKRRPQKPHGRPSSHHKSGEGHRRHQRSSRGRS